MNRPNSHEFGYQNASRRWAPLLWAFAAVLSGCAGGGKPPAAGPADASQANNARSEVERGPVRVTVEVTPQPARLSDEPVLRLTIDYQRDVAIEKPPFGSALGDFVIRDFQEPLPETRGDRRIVQQVYTLEPMRTGDLAIDPITVTFTDNRPTGDRQKHTVQTEALTVKVLSSLDTDRPSLDDLQPPAGPVPLAAPPASRWWWLAAALLLAAVAGGIWRLRRRRKEQAEARLSPREQAYLELQELLREDLAAADVKRFYVCLTGVVRRYIEESTGVRAPEQTTEEFLREIGGRQVFDEDERRRLANFLEVADLVKYAAHQPRREDIEGAFQRAQVFIGLEPEGVAA